MSGELFETGQAGISELTGKRVDQSLGEARHFGEQGYQFYELSRARLFKKYSRGKLGVCVKVRCGVRERDREHLYLFFADLDGADWGEGRLYTLMDHLGRAI